MKNAFFVLAMLLAVVGCTTSGKTFSDTKNKLGSVNDTVRIKNDSLQYEVIIVDGGFSSWLNSYAHPRNYHALSYLENKNRMYVTEWNNRVLQPSRYSPDLYEMQINYNFNIKYGYEVNYLIYNYLVYFQNKNNQRLAGVVPTR